MPPKKKQVHVLKTKKKRKQLVIKSKSHSNVDSEASTLVDSGLHAALEQGNEDGTQNLTYRQDESESEGSELSELEDFPVRDDMPVQTGRWKTVETDALMDAINVNRDALKFHFSGTSGGKEVKRQAWRDVTAYVNDVANTHRTMAQCVSKTSDYTQRAKEKYNKLRRRVGQTGGGGIPRNMRLKETQQKALDYLRVEAVKGIPGIEPMEIGGLQREPPSNENLALLWKADRPNKVDYSKIAMKRMGIPKGLAKKKLSREARLAKMERKKQHERKMLLERKAEEQERRRIEGQRERGRKENEKLQELFKRKQEGRAQAGMKKELKDKGKEKKGDKAERKKWRALVRLSREERRLKRELDDLQSQPGEKDEPEKKEERKTIRAQIRKIRLEKKKLEGQGQE